MIDLFNGSVYTYGSSASIRVIIKYEKQRVGVDMQYRFYYKIYVNGSSAYYQNNVRGTFILNGTTVWTKNTKNTGTNWSYEYTSDWFTIENKVDGTVPFKFTIKDTVNSSWCNYSSSTYNLAIDPAGSDFNVVPSFNIGQPFSLTTTKYNADFYDKIVIKLGETIIKTYENVISPLLVQFSQEELDNIYELTKTVQYSDFTFEISSYEDDEMTSQVGATNTTSSKGYIVASNPVISSKNAIDINTNTITLTGDNTKVIKGFSNIEVTINASGQNKATIKSITVNNQNATNGSIIFNKETTNVFNIVVTDSRGFQTTDSIILTLIDYVQLSLNATIERNQPTDNQVKISYSGNYFNESFGSVANTLNVQYRFKEKGQTFTDSDAWIDLSPTKSNNTFSQSNFLVGDVDYRKMYEFQIRAVDKLMGKQIIEIYIPKGETVFNWDDELFNVNVKTTLKQNLEVSGSIKGDTLGEVNSAKSINENIGKGLLRYLFNVNSGIESLFPSLNNANSILHFNKHDGDYDSQLGFSSNGKIYYRNAHREQLIETTWQEIAFAQDVKPIVLWSNPNPSNSFSSQTITLESDDFDIGIIIFRTDDSENKCNSGIFYKGYGSKLIDFSVPTSTTYASLMKLRNVSYVSDTSLRFDACLTKRSNATNPYETNNNFNVPIKIIGFKL